VHGGRTKQNLALQKFEFSVGEFWQSAKDDWQPASLSPSCRAIMSFVDFVYVPLNSRMLKINQIKSICDTKQNLNECDTIIRQMCWQEYLIYAIGGHWRR